MPVEIVINAIKFLPILISLHRTDRIGKRDSHVYRDRPNTYKYNCAISSR